MNRTERRGINVLMFGWELPPYNSGGLGTACLGLTEELVPRGINVDFVVPKSFGAFPFKHMNILNASDYPLTEETLRLLSLNQEQLATITNTLGYGDQVNTTEINGSTTLSFDQRRALPRAPHAQAAWYAHQAATIASQQQFDLIHCHEWMTYYCGIAARQTAKDRGQEVPFLAHVHATEIDRGGEQGHPDIMAIEHKGFHAADRVVAVSHYTKNIVHKYYDVPNEKISVVHNGISLAQEPEPFNFSALKKHYKLVLFMGRLTRSKGPDYFLRVAKEVTDRDPKVKFLMIGSGDLQRQCIEKAARMGLTGKILFSSFLRGTDVNKAYQLADLFIMPSVSEPFGLVALEAIHNGTPAIISKQSGVAEVSDNFLKIDFWDIDAMQRAVLELLYSPAKAATLAKAGKQDLHNLTWKKSSEQMHALYQDVLNSFSLSSPAHA